MLLNHLLQRLPDQVVTRASLADPHADVYTVGFITTSNELLREDILYFCYEEVQERQLLPNRTHSFVVSDGSKAHKNLSDRSDINLIVLDSDANPYSCFNALQGAFIESQKVTAIVRRLLQAHFSNRGLQYLIEEAASALGHPIVVVDPTYRYIAYHLGDLSEDDTVLSRMMTAEIANETVLDQAIAYIRDTHIDSKIAQSNGILEQHNELLECTTLTSAVMVGGVCIAHVMMMDRLKPFSTTDREVFGRIALFVAQELQKSEVWSPTSGEMGSYFLGNLLSNRSPSEAVTRRRLKAVNFHPKPMLYVVCLHAPGEGLSQEQVEHIAAQLRPVLHHALYTRYHQQLVVLLSRDEDTDLSERTEPKLCEVAALNGLTVGISNAFKSLTQTRVAYEQARTAIRLGDAARSPIDDHGLYHYHEYASAQLLELANRRINLISVCHPTLLKLLEYDDRHGGELMDTLFCYLQVAGNTTRASQILCLHKNTMLYRLGRIREVLGLNLASGEDLFALQLSFRALIYLGMFSPRFTPSRDELRG